MHRHVRTRLVRELICPGVYVAMASRHLTFGIWKCPSITACKETLHVNCVRSSCKRSGVLTNDLSGNTCGHRRARAPMKYTEHSAHVWSQRRSPLMKSPSAKINSVTFEVMLSTHYSRGQLKEEEEKDEEGGRRVWKQSTHGPGWIMQPLKWSLSPAVAWSGMWHLTYESTIADHRLDRPHQIAPRPPAAAEVR